MLTIINHEKKPLWHITSHPLGWSLYKYQEISKQKNVGEVVGKLNSLHTVGGNVKWCSHYGKQYRGFSKNEKIYNSCTAAAAAAKLLQSCPTLCDPIDGSPPGSRIPGILQARTLEWVAISFSNAWKWKVKGKLLSHVWLPATPWTAAHQAPPSMGFSRQEHLSGVPLPSSRD